MITIVKTIAGSKLFGASTPMSDTDYKFLFLPNAEDILMQRAPKNIQQKTKTDDSQRNTSEDVDCEGFSLQNFLSMAANGQTLAIEMLFTPPELTTETSPLWSHIQRNADKLVSKKIGPFVGYCRAQSSKYCVKAERLQAADLATAVFARGLEHHNSTPKIETILPWLLEVAEKSEFIEVQHGNESHNDNWFSCCGRKVPLTASIRRGYDLYNELLEGYGARARIAANGEGIDWKALYHAYRVGCEANELLTTGKLTLPRPEAATLLQIRSGQLCYQTVSDLIQEQVDEVEKNLLTTNLPEEADWEWINKAVLGVHGIIVKEWMSEKMWETAK
jgi:hypothetical protein